jgi:hypothetical protein
MSKVAYLPSLALIAIFGVAVLNAQPAPRSARLAIRNGLVEVQRGNGWVPIVSGDTLNTGERIRTGSGSSAAIELGAGKVVTLTELSQMQLGASNTSLVPQIENGSMKVFSSSQIQVAAKDTILESVNPPVDLELGYQSGNLNLRVFNGAVKNGAMTIHGENLESFSSRTVTAGRSSPQQPAITPNPASFYIYPYFLYGRPGASNDGAIVPPVVNNPTNPGYRPTQVVPPMSDPLRVPVVKPQ